MPAIAQHLDPIAFSPEFFARLELLGLRLRRRRTAGAGGPWKSGRHGASLEFADYRNYTPGDDPRHVDWNAYGRTDRLFTKIFEGEQDLAVSVLVDSSRSMHCGGEGAAKFRSARQLAAAIAALAILKLDRVNVGWFDTRILRDSGFRRGRGALHEVLAFLSDPPPDGGGTSLAGAAEDWCGRLHWRGPVFVVSDFLDGPGAARALQIFDADGFEPVFLQVLSPAELAPALDGNCLLEDSETGAILPLEIDAGVRKTAAGCAAAAAARIGQLGAANGAGYFLLQSDRDIEETVLQGLRRAGILH